jgi:hypothetical protein
MSIILFNFQCSFDSIQFHYPITTSAP